MDVFFLLHSFVAAIGSIWFDLILIQAYTYIRPGRLYEPSYTAAIAIAKGTISSHGAKNTIWQHNQIAHDHQRK